jgi:DNA modification methylase
MRLTKQINAYNVDCMDFMKDKPDNYYDLAIVDPPYGIGISQQSQGKGGGVALKIDYAVKNWDSAVPTREYFIEVMRSSVNQIIWGGNYFGLRPTPCFIVWDKLNGATDFADCELAWTSFNTAVRKFEWRWAGMLQQNMSAKEERMHPTQKPVALYRWLLTNYAKEGDKILDTHGGSFSSAIACHKEGFDLDICELDTDYFNDAVNRFKLNTCQKELEFARPD